MLLDRGASGPAPCRERSRSPDKQSRSGISIEKLGVWSLCVKPPIWNSENEQCEQVSHCASDAAIFIGCSCATRMPKWLPNHMFTQATGTRTISASLAARLNASGLRPRARLPAAHAQHHRCPGRQPAKIVCPERAHSAQSLDSSFQMLVSWASPFTTL